MFMEACLKNSTKKFLHDKNVVVWTLYVDPHIIIPYVK